MIAELSIPGEAGQVRAASAWLESSAASFAVPREQSMRLSICLNEILANIISHGGPGALAVPVALRLEVTRQEELCKAVLGVRDGGHPFDPTSHVTRPRPSSLAQAEPGGLGLVMIRDNADAMHYRRVDESNQLEIVVNWPLPSDFDWIPLFQKVDGKALRRPGETH